MFSLKIINFSTFYFELGGLKGVRTRGTAKSNSLNFWYNFRYKLYGYVDFIFLYRYLLLASISWTNVLQRFTSKSLLILDPGVYTILHNGYNNQSILADTYIAGGISNHLSINPTVEMGLSSFLKNYQYTKYDLVGIFSSNFWTLGNGGLNGAIFSKFKGLVTSTLNSSDTSSWSKMDLFLPPTSINTSRFSFFYWKFFKYLTYFQEFKYLRFKNFFFNLNFVLKDTRNKINYLYKRTTNPPYQLKEFYFENAKMLAKKYMRKKNHQKMYSLQTNRFHKFTEIIQNTSMFPKMSYYALKNIPITKIFTKKYSFLKVKRLTKKYAKFISFLGKKIF